MIHRGADVNKMSKESKTPLITAVIFSQVKSLLLLLKAGADVNQTDRKNSMALIEVLQCDRSESVELLLKSGTDVNIHLIRALKIGDKYKCVMKLLELM